MILVAGGTGFVGSAVVQELLKRGESVAVLGRDADKVRRRFADRVVAVQADVGSPKQLSSVFEGIDTVVNAVQFPTSPIEIPRRGWTFEEVDYRGNVNLVNAAVAAGVGRFLYMSGVGAAHDAPKHWFRFKWMAEQALVNSGLEWTVIRPTWVYGKDDVALNRLIGFSSFLPFVPMFGAGRQKMQPVFIDDVARVVCDAIATTAASSQVFELGGPEVMSMNEVLQSALGVMERKRFILHQPIFVGKLLGRTASLLPTPPLSADAIDFIDSPAVADNTKVLAILKAQLTPFRAGLETYLARH